MGLGECCARSGHASELIADQLESPPRNEHRGTIDDVLARRTEVDVAGRLASDNLPQSAHERLRRVAGRAPRRDDRVDIEALDPAGVGDWTREMGWNDARKCFGVHERALDLEHRFDPRAVRDRRADLLRYEDRVECHSAKNTVSSGP